MSWLRAAAVLALACSPMLATAAHATSHHRIHHAARYAVHARVAHHAHRRTAAQGARHHRFAGAGHHRLAEYHLLAEAPSGVGVGKGARLQDAGKQSFDVVAAAERYRGTNPTGWSHQWCAAFANLVLERTGHRGSGSAAARSFAHYGSPAPGPVPGAIIVFPHHVGFVIGVAGPGRVRVVSGNHGHRVGDGIYSTRSVIAYRYPT
jgi:uncharacterized protein (TIGR02594 family)